MNIVKKIPKQHLLNVMLSFDFYMLFHAHLRHSDEKLSSLSNAQNVFHDHTVKLSCSICLATRSQNIFFLFTFQYTDTGPITLVFWLTPGYSFILVSTKSYLKCNITLIILWNFNALFSLICPHFGKKLLVQQIFSINFYHIFSMSEFRNKT